MKRVGGRFVLEREIGAGGMSTVFLGRDEVLDRHVAVKILKSGFEESDIGARFRREGRTAARLSHPNIVQVYDAGEDDLEGRPISYIVMEYIAGGDLKGLIDAKGPLPETDLARIGAGVALGLAHAHERGIIHRDVKPQNVLIDEYGCPKLADFGIARALDQATAHSTRTGSYLGTATYSSPEQLRAEKITPKSDIYSLGATLYHAAVGEPPFTGAPIEVASQQLSRPAASPRERGAAIGEAFEDLILSCLAKEPADRPEAAELHTRLLQRGAASATSAKSAGPSATRSIGAAGAAGLVGAVRIAKSAREAGASGLEAIARRMGGRFGQWERSDGSGIPTRTMVVSTRTFQSSASRAAVLISAAAILLVLMLLIWATFAFFGSSAGDDAQSSGQQAASETARQQRAGGNENQASADDQTKGAASQKEPTPEKPAPEKEQAPSGPTPPAGQASDAVYNMYVSAATNDFASSWSYLSRRYQDEVGSLRAWEDRQSSLGGVFFERSPRARVVDGKAEVDFEVQETRDGSLKTVRGTWVCVNENGEWKLDRLTEGG